MSDEKALTVVAQRAVTFYGDELIAVKADDEHIYVSVRHMCQALGLSRQAQVRRIKRQEILAEGFKGGAILAPPSPEGRGGGEQQAGLLRVDLVPLWLTGISLEAVKEEIRPKLERYQREAARVLWEAFQEGRLTADPAFSELLKADTPAVRAYKNALAIVELARNQVIMEARLTDHERRLEAIEAQLGDPGRTITPEQASQISQAIKAVALVLGKKSGRNEYGGVYGELYRKFGITGYKLLPARRFQEAIDWLDEWHKTVTGQNIPF
ncbi:MAG: ORF6C domain-containing protein [Chloroflexi bacterium]|nr:ORF6C domain-containing protein [Chloroflexota bacterium]